MFFVCTWNLHTVVHKSIFRVNFRFLQKINGAHEEFYLRMDKILR